jgi:hypothetical protein
MHAPSVMKGLEIGARRTPTIDRHTTCTTTTTKNQENLLRFKLQRQGRKRVVACRQVHFLVAASAFATNSIEISFFGSQLIISQDCSEQHLSSDSTVGTSQHLSNWRKSSLTSLLGYNILAGCD